MSGFETLQLATLRIKSATALMRMELVLRSLAELFEDKYSPNQPRAPKGTPEGGQWIVDPSSARQQRLAGERVRVAQIRREPSFYIFDFKKENREGRGHVWPKHIGRTRLDLASRLMSRTWPTVRNGRPAIAYDPVESTFLTEGDANFFVSEVLKTHSDAVEQVVRGEPYKVLNMRFGYPTGLAVSRDRSTQLPVFRPTFAVRVIIRHDPRKENRGYFVETAFPMNEVADERVRGDER